MAGEFISFYFHYKFSRKIPFTTLSGNIANVNFVTENNSIIGLDITIQGPMELGKAQDKTDALAFVLSDLISIKSQKYTIPSLSGFEADDVHGNRHVQGGLVLMWDFEGAPANLENIDLRVLQYMRNTFHNNGTHIAGKPINLQIENYSFIFDKNCSIDCASWAHVTVAMKATFEVVAEILNSVPVKALAWPVPIHIYS